MGTPSCCYKCDAPLGWATLDEIEAGDQVCPSCGYDANPLNRTLFDALRETEERLTKVERALWGINYKAKS